MANALDMKRLGALVMALLIVAAVAGPVCLMFASSAMAMPMETQTSPCDQDDGSTACPYERPVSNIGVKAPTIDPVAALSALPVDDGSGLVETSFIARVADVSEDPPPAHLTPLRI